jgi:hypothetical protein
MNRRHALIVGGALSALLMLYCLSFGPVVYLWAKADQYGLMPEWLDDSLSVVFHPHIWVMYHTEPYFDYILWFAELGDALDHEWSWTEFRKEHSDTFE